ncbi:MAG: protoglobin domain-containing protein [bacterium]
MSISETKPSPNRDDRAAYEQQVEFLQVTQSERQILQDLAGFIVPRLPGIIDRFYSTLRSFPVTRPYFSTPGTVERLKIAQLEYFTNIFAHAFTPHDIQKHKNIGNTHVRIGLQPKWYIGGYALYCQYIFPLLRQKYPDDSQLLETAQVALLKAMFLDMQIVLETYIERYSSELIEARTALEQKLWMEDRLLTFILNEATDAIVGLDEQGRIATWSQGAQSIFGYKTSETLDKSITDLIQEPEMLNYLFEEAEKKGSATLQGSHWLTKEGKSIEANATLTYLQDQHGTHIGWSLLVQNLTDVRRLADKVKSMEQLSAMTKITAGVAHEIRTPLGVIALTADLIQHRVDLILEQCGAAVREAQQPEINELMAELHLEVERLNEIVDHYLVLSRIKKPNKQRCHLPSYLEDILSSIRSRQGSSAIEIALQAEEDLYVDIDPAHFRRIFLNLYENSRFAIEGRGKITVTAQQADEQAEIRFRDNGAGIPPEKMDRIFTAFNTNRPGGTGLGLYLVREIVEAHQGTVTIESTEGKGTMVIITLPLAVEEIEKHAAS